MNHTIIKAAPVIAMIAVAGTAGILWAQGNIGIGPALGIVTATALVAAAIRTTQMR